MKAGRRPGGESGGGRLRVTGEWGPSQRRVSSDVDWVQAGQHWSLLVSVNARR